MSEDIGEMSHDVSERFTMLYNGVMEAHGASLGPMGLAVYWCLSMHGSGRESFPSRKRIATMTGMSVASVDRAVAKLKEVGLLSVEHRERAGGGQTSNLYRTRSKPAQQPPPLSHSSPPPVTQQPPPTLCDAPVTKLIELDVVNPPATAAPRRERTRDPLFEAFVEEWGFDPMKPASKIKGLAGDFSARVKRTNKDIDVPTLLVAWREFAAYSRKERHGGQAKWGSVVQQHNATDQFLSWLTVNGPNAGRVWGEGAIRDERWYFVDPSGRMALKAPRIAIAELGLSCDPHRPQTWPQDMYEVYRSRLVTIDGQEVFA